MPDSLKIMQNCYILYFVGKKILKAPVGKRIQSIANVTCILSIPRRRCKIDKLIYDPSSRVFYAKVLLFCSLVKKAYSFLKSVFVYCFNRSGG